MTNKRTCENCQRELDVGVDAFTVEKGVFGMKGFVSLEGPTFFCSENCIEKYYDVSDLPSMPRRIP
jgi:hypothetical protein